MLSHFQHTSEKNTRLLQKLTVEPYTHLLIKVSLSFRVGMRVPRRSVFTHWCLRCAGCGLAAGRNTHYRHTLQTDITDITNTHYRQTLQTDITDRHYKPGAHWNSILQILLTSPTRTETVLRRTERRQLKNLPPSCFKFTNTTPFTNWMKIRIQFYKFSHHFDKIRNQF